jgi:hypothetical protein
MGMSSQVSRPGHFIPTHTSPGAPCLGDWVGPRVGLEAGKELLHWPCRESKSGRPARSLVTILTELPPEIQ